MEGSAAAALQVLVQNLISVSKEEISLIRGLEKDAKKLNETLDIIQKFLNDAEMRSITDEAVKSWLKKLEDVAFDADNVLDELSYHDLSKKMKTMEAVKKKVPSCFSSFNHIVRRHQMAHKIKEINMRFESINKKATELGLEKRLADAHAAPDAASETDSFTVDPIFIGRDNDVSRVVEMLTTSPTEQVFSILPIVGMGGLGKTTLARKVYHDENIRTHFGKHIWVHVPRKFDPMILFKKILTTLKPKNDEVGSRKVLLKESDKIESREGLLKESDEVECREVLLKKLQEALGTKTYLLVLDDVWNQDQRKWDDFINSLTGISSVKGNSIIVTTRNTEVASMVQTLPFHKLENISEDNCWSIIKAKTFGGGDIPPGFETIGRNIANRCQGLPLAANIVGGVLRGKSEDDWRKIEDNWISGVGGDENNISKILKLSFDNLSSPSLKRCFAYCSIFPKGYHIDREDLIELWMAEGFLQADQSNDMEAVGNKFFSLLLQNSLLQVARRGYNGSISECNMHDLVHDLARSVLSSSKVRYIGPQRYGDQSSSIPTEEAKCLRTLFFKGEISDNMFSDFKCLHVLTLIGTNVKELPSSIRKLIHLRYLDISYTSIEYLPDWIGELYHLQTLKADLEELPSTLKYLINLRQLPIPSYSSIELPPEIGRLTSLRVLPYFEVGDEEGRRIEELGSLQNLKGELRISNLEKVHDKEEAKSAYLFQKPNLFELGLEWNHIGEGERNDENVLEGLQPHRNLKSLRICGFKGTSFPPWTLKMADLNKLMEIQLSGCTECEEIPMLGHLPLLKSLHLTGLSNVRSIRSSFYGIDSCSSNNNGVCKDTVTVFPALETLYLSFMSNLTEWGELEFPSAAETQPREVKAFPCLKQLEIVCCEGLINLPCGMLKSCAPSLESLLLKSLSSVTNLPMVIDVLQEMPRLTKLEIFLVPQFILSVNGSSIGIGSFRSLQQLSIISTSDSPEHWDSLPDSLQHLTALSMLQLQNFEIEILPEWFGNLSSLKTLFLCDCKKLRRLPSMEAMRCLTKLTHLDIKNCPLLKERCIEQQSDDSEWPKISQIPFIFVDYRQIQSHGSVSETPN